MPRLSAVIVSERRCSWPLLILLQLAGKTLLAYYTNLGGYDLKDRIISETNLKTWESLVEQLKANELKSEAELAAS